MTERVACVRLCAPLLRDVQLWGFHDTFVTVNSSTTEQPNDGRAERGLCGGLNVTCTAFQTSQVKTKQKHTKTKNIYLKQLYIHLWYVCIFWCNFAFCRKTKLYITTKTLNQLISKKNNPPNPAITTAFLLLRFEIFISFYWDMRSWWILNSRNYFLLITFSMNYHCSKNRTQSVWIYKC